MNERVEFLIGIAERARNTTAIEPKAVSKARKSSDDFDQNIFHDALAEEFPFLRNLIPLLEQDQTAVYGIFRWLVDQLIEVEARCSQVPLLHILPICAELDLGSTKLWQELSTIGQLRAVRLQELRALIISRKIPLVENKRRLTAELIQSFQEACEIHDWNGIDVILQHITAHLYDATLSSAARALSIFSPVVLENALSEINDIASLIAVLETLLPLQTLKILKSAADSTNWPLKFWALRLSIDIEARETRSEFEGIWGELLCQAAQKRDEWEKWVTVFNVFPSRYPVLQRSMGMALCTISDEAIVQYIGAVRLSISNHRGDLEVAFKFVQKHANEVQRKRVWKIAYDRWKAWEFCDDNQQSRILSIQSSSLDIAVASYYLECLNREERDVVEKNLQSAFNELQNAWYEGISDYLSALNKHLSYYQPLGQAHYALTTQEQWVQGLNYYQPDWVSSNLYWRIRTHQRAE